MLTVMHLLMYLVDIISGAVYPIPTFKPLSVEVRLDCIFFIAASCCSLSCASAAHIVLVRQCNSQSWKALLLTASEDL